MKSKSIVIVVAAILAVSAAAIIINYGLSGDESDAETTKFLIQDDKGVYFWIEGEGDDGFTALDDACKKFDVPLSSSDSSYGKSIDSVFGLQMIGAGDIWTYWAQYSFIDGEWKVNEVSIEKVKTSEVEAIALVYSSTGAAPAATPDDAKVWDHSTKGTVFTIESSSGLYFKVNGTGGKVIDAFINATAAYNIPFLPTSGSNPTGIDSIFGLEMTMVEPISDENPYGVYHWWIQKVRTADGTGWESASALMSQLNSSDAPEMKLVYGTEAF